MGVTVEFAGLTSDGDHFEVKLRDGDLVAVASFHCKALTSLKHRPIGVAELVASEIAAALQALESRRTNRPELGALVRVKAYPDERRRVVAMNADRSVVTLSYGLVPPGVGLDDVTARWSDCEYVP